MQIDTIPALQLLGNMADVTIRTQEDVSVVVSCDGEAITEHVYSPTAEGLVRISLKDIVRPLLTLTLSDSSTPYRQERIVRTFSIKATTIADAPQTQTQSFTVVRAGVDRLAETPANFLQANFLTWQPQVKGVTYYTPEFLTYYAPSAATIRCTAHFEDGTEASLTLATIPAGQCWTVPVQYAVIVGKLSGRLPAYYDVWAESSAGNRYTYIQRYVAQVMRSEEELWILFENSLGGIDTFRAYGDSENTAEHTHNVAEVDDDSEEYRVDTHRTFRKNTGYLGRTERRWLLDFFPSLGKYAYTGTFIRRIVVTESNAVYNQKELPTAYDFTYRYADERPYLNLPRTDQPTDTLDMRVPTVGSFTIAPRLAEFPRLSLSDGALFPVQNPYAEEWTVTSLAELRQHLLQGIMEGGTGIELLDAIAMVDGYLTVYGDKVKAAWADIAGDVSPDSPAYKRWLRRDTDDTAEGVITFEKEPWARQGQVWGRNNFVSGPFGRGARVDADGNAEVESLYSRSFISTPEFRFQQITVTEGENWCANGRGEIAQAWPGMEFNQAGEMVSAESQAFGVIELHLDDDEYASVREGGICKGMYNAMKGGYGSDPRFARDADDPDAVTPLDQNGTPVGDNALYTAPEGETDYNGGQAPEATEGTAQQNVFRQKYGFFSSYFYVKRIVENSPGRCVFEYGLRNSSCPHPCRFMKFVQYGHFTDPRFQNFSYESAIGPYVKIVCQGVSTWNPMVQNITHIWGWLGGMKVKLKGGEEAYRTFPHGNGMFVQDNVYLGGVIQNLSVETIGDLKEQLGQYTIELSEHVDVITVDDAGNAIGGLWTDETYTDADGNEQTARTYRITCAITVKKGGNILTLAPEGADTPGRGQYRLYATLHGCTIDEQLLQQSSLLCINGIEHIKDGVAGTADDTNFDYDAMRQTSACSVDIIAVCEADGYSVAVNVPVAVKHDSQPFVGADMENEHSGVSYNEKTGAFVGLPVDIPLRMWKNDTDLKITGLSIRIGDTTRKYARLLGGFDETAFQPPILLHGTDLFPYGIYISASDETVNGVRRPVLHLTTAGDSLPAQTDIAVTVATTYSGVSYERTLVHTVTRVNDLSVYSLSIAPAIIHKRKNQADDVQTVKATVIGESSDDGKYVVESAQRTAKKLCIMCRLLSSADSASAIVAAAADLTTEADWTAGGWTKADTIDTTATARSVLFALLQDGKLYAGETEEVPVMEDGDDGTDVEYVFYAPGASDGFTPDPTKGFPQIDESDTYGGKTRADAEYLPKVVGTSLRWTDDPTGVAANRLFEYYARREKKNGAWGSFSDVHVWNHYAEDGDPALVFDLTNENSFVQATEDGTVVGDYETTRCVVYEAGRDVSDKFDFTIDTDNTQHIEATIQNGVVTPANMDRTDATTGAVVSMAVVVVKATGKDNTAYAGKLLIANFYVRKTYAAVVYRLSVSAPAIPCQSDGTPKSGNIMFSVVRSERGTQTILDSMTRIAAEGLTIYLQKNGSGTKTALDNNNIVALSNALGKSDSYLKVELAKGQDTWDTETIFKTLDGTQGETVAGQGIFRSTVFTRTYDDISAIAVTGGSYANGGLPGDSTYTVGGEQKTVAWSDGIPSGEGDVWSVSRVFTSDGKEPQTSAWSSPRKTLDIPDVYDVEFCAGALGAVPADPDAAPAIWYDPSTGRNKAGTMSIGDTGAPAGWTEMNWRAERVKVDGAWGGWVITQIKGEQGAPGPFTATAFRRTNDDISQTTPSGGSYADPKPTGWSDGIPAGTEKLWATTARIEYGQAPSWSSPREMTDTETYDVEFCPYTADDAPSGVTFTDGQPPTPTAANRHGGSGTQAWFDPTLDASLPSGLAWTDMVWRAEKETVNGVAGNWVITRIKGEQGDAAVSFYITADRSTAFQCDADGKISEPSASITLKGWQRTAGGEAENLAFFFRRVSNVSTVAESTAKNQIAYTLSKGAVYTSFVVEIYATAAAASEGTAPLAQLAFEFSRQGEQGRPGSSIIGPQGLQGLVVRVTEWEAGKEYRDDEDTDDSDVSRYLDIVTISKDKDGNFWDQAVRLDAFAFKCAKTHVSSADNRPLDSTDTFNDRDGRWEQFSVTGPLTTPLLWAARAVIDYLQVNQIAIVENGAQVGGIGNGYEFTPTGSTSPIKVPLWFGDGTESGFAFLLENSGRLSVGGFGEGRQRIVLDPVGKSIRIYDAGGVLVTELSAQKYHSVSGGETSLYDSSQNERAISETLEGIEMTEDAGTYRTELTLKTGGEETFDTSASSTSHVRVWLFGLLSFNTATPKTVELLVDTEADGTTATLSFGAVERVARTLNLSSALMPASCLRGVSRLRMVVTSADDTPLSITPYNTKLLWMQTNYKAHYFGNGLTIGTNKANHFSVYNANINGSEQQQRMNVAMVNDKGGFFLGDNGLRIDALGRQQLVPIVLMQGRVVGATGNSPAFEGIVWNSAAANGGVSVAKGAKTGLFTLTLARDIRLSIDGRVLGDALGSWGYMVFATPYDTAGDGILAPLQRTAFASETQLTVEFDKWTNFTIRVEYMGSL